MAEIYDGTDVDYDTAERTDQPVPTATAIADCGHANCYTMRVANGTRWCELGHRLMVGITAEGLSGLMAAVSTAAAAAYERGHTSTAISQWRLVLMLETAAKLTDDANSTRTLIETLSS